MSKMMSNTEIMDMFKEIDEFKATSTLPPDKLAEAVRQKQNRIVEELRFLVFSNTKMYRNFPNYEDLLQEGYMGLIKAVRKFEWQRFPNFFVYSNQWIRHSVKRAASRFDVVYNPNKSRVVYSEPDENEAIPMEEGPEAMFLSQEKTDSINRILGEFPDRDREIVQRIFGLGGHKPQTLREIGPQFNLTYERVRQIKNSVITKLRKNQTLYDLQN